MKVVVRKGEKKESFWNMIETKMKDERIAKTTKKTEGK